MSIKHNNHSFKSRLMLVKLSAIVFLTSWMASCSNEVEVIGLWKDIPVVYGVINWQDTAHYIRIERAYLPPNKSALDVARNADSLYFDPSQVVVELYSIGNNNDTVLWNWPLERVNLADEGIVREDGIFQNNPSYAYKTKGGPTGRDLLLKIDHRATGNVFYSRVKPISANNSSLFTIPRYSKSPPRPVKFRELNPQGEEIYGSLGINISTSFAAIYDYIFRFHYDEYTVDAQGNEISGTRVDKTIEWRAVSDFIPQVANQNKQSVSGSRFYRFLRGNLSDVTGTNKRRCGGYLEVFAVGGTESIRDYILARKANDGFVGGLFPAPPYSNVSGGYGFLGVADVLERADRASSPRLMEMSPLTYEHLSNGELTSQLGFSPNPCY